MTEDVWDVALRAAERARELHERSAELVATARATVIASRTAGAVVGRQDALAGTFEGLLAVMRSRARIEQAKGVVIATTGCSPQEALDLLVRRSHREHRRLPEVADDLVRGAQRAGG